jgi:hypothetical protein
LPAKKTNYDLVDTEQPDSLLVAAGLKLDVACLQSANLLALQMMAQQHAEYQAIKATQGHQLWDERVKDLYVALPKYGEFAEICAESWPDQSVDDAAAEMYNSWRQSPGHWSAVTSTNAGWGAAMAFCSRRRVWYACMIFAQAGSNG